MNIKYLEPYFKEISSIKLGKFQDLSPVLHLRSLSAMHSVFLRSEQCASTRHLPPTTEVLMMGSRHESSACAPVMLFT